MGAAGSGFFMVRRIGEQLVGYDRQLTCTAQRNSNASRAKRPIELLTSEDASKIVRDPTPEIVRRAVSGSLEEGAGHEHLCCTYVLHLDRRRGAQRLLPYGSSL